MEGHKTEINKTSNSLEGSRISIFFSRVKWNVLNPYTNLTESKWGLSILYIVVTLIFLIMVIVDEMEGSY